MACPTLLTADILNNCDVQPIKGLKPKAWAFNRSQLTVTATNNSISALANIGAATGFSIEGFKDFMNAGYDAVVTENMPTMYTHYFSVNLWAATAAEKKNIDKADDIIVIVEKNGAQGEGTFLAYGYKNGLWKSSQTRRANDAQGVATAEFTSREGMGEEYSEYVVNIGGSYATTLAALNALL